VANPTAVIVSYHNLYGLQLETFFSFASHEPELAESASLRQGQVVAQNENGEISQ
jgi:hypothetical protein